MAIKIIPTDQNNDGEFNASEYVVIPESDKTTQNTKPLSASERYFKKHKKVYGAEAETSYEL